MPAVSSAPSPLRLAIAGCGNVLDAYLAVADSLQRQGRAHLLALCGPERHRPKATLHQIPRFHSNYAELLDSPDVDAVILLTPMRDHAPMAAAALDAGKHVLLEKPLATSLVEGAALVAQARSAGKLLLCAPFTVLSPTFRTIDRRLRAGDLGRVIAARGRYGWAGPDWTDWFYRPGGGALFDLGVYNLTTLTGWLGPVRHVTAMAGVAIPERSINGRQIRVEAEDNVQLLLDFGNACYATVFAGFTIQQYRGPGLELFGTEGTLYLHGDDWDPDGYELWQNSAGCWQFFKETRPDWPWADGLRHLVDCVQNREPLRVTPDHAYHVLEIMIRAQEAAKDGVTRTIESTFPPLNTNESQTTIAAHRIHDRTRAE